MAIEFASVVSAPPSGRRAATIIDHQHYAQSVILRGHPIPWDDTVAYSNFFGQAQGLLKPDATLLDLGALYDFLLAADEALTAAMSARTRRGYALKTLLADKHATERMLDLARVLSQTSSAPLVVQIPSPMRWLAQTHVSSGAGSIDDLDADHAENVSMYVADWLRSLSTLPVSMLLLDARQGVEGPTPTVEPSAYTPIVNAAEHYRWTLAQRTEVGIEFVSNPSLSGVAVPHEYWRSEQATAPSGDVLIAEIPPDAVPETVLAQLARLS